MSLNSELLFISLNILDGIKRKNMLEKHDILGCVMHK